MPDYPGMREHLGLDEPKPKPMRNDGVSPDNNYGSLRARIDYAESAMSAIVEVLPGLESRSYAEYAAGIKRALRCEEVERVVESRAEVRTLNARVQELIGEKEALQNRLGDAEGSCDATVKRLREDLLIAQQDTENANYAVAQSSDELLELREANETFNGMCAENNRLKDELQALKDAKPMPAPGPGRPFVVGPPPVTQRPPHHLIRLANVEGFKEGCEFMKSMVVLP